MSVDLIHTRAACCIHLRESWSYRVGRQSWVFFPSVYMVTIWTYSFTKCLLLETFETFLVYCAHYARNVFLLIPRVGLVSANSILFTKFIANLLIVIIEGSRGYTPVFLRVNTGRKNLSLNLAFGLAANCSIKGTFWYILVLH